MTKCRGQHWHAAMRAAWVACSLKSGAMQMPATHTQCRSRPGLVWNVSPGDTSRRRLRAARHSQIISKHSQPATISGGFTLWPGTGPRIPNFSSTLDTLWSIDAQKISKFDATRCQILRLKCTRFDFRWGSAPYPAEELTTLPQTL